MRLIFVDETSDFKFSDYFGLSVAVMNSSFYGQIKRGFQRILTDAGWDPCVEFKGSYLFSATKGCQNVGIEERIGMASAILSLSVAKANARMRFAYCCNRSTDAKSDYLKYLPPLLGKALPRAETKAGKNLAAIYCDYRSDLRASEIQEAVLPTLEHKGYTLLEDVVTVDSSFHTVGILYADLVAYLAGRIDTISNDSELFDSIPADQLQNNGRVRKLRASVALINRVKRLQAFRVADT